MVSFNIKKKAVMTFTELILIMISLVIIFLCIYMSSNFIGDSKQNIETLSPKLHYEFPSIFLKTFLMFPLNETHIKSFEKKGIKANFVKDIIIFDDDETKELIEDYKGKYFDEINSLSSSSSKDFIYYYNSFSEENIEMSDLIKIRNSIAFGNLPNIENLIQNNNYVFYLKDESGTYTVIYFKS